MPSGKSKKSQFGIEWDTSAKGLSIKLLEYKTNTRKENTETILGASSNVGLEINVQETKYMIMTRH
jgi:hypothetical protein